MEQLSMFASKSELDSIRSRYIEFITKKVQQRFNQDGLYYSTNHVMDIQKILKYEYISDSDDIAKLVAEVEYELKKLYGSRITFNRTAREVVVFVRGFVVHLDKQLIITKG